jgi:predicted kinase
MKPFLIIIDGQNAAGKSTVARKLREDLPFTAFIFWDVLKKFISDFEPNERYHGIAAEVAKAMVDVYLTNGVNVVYEAIFGPRKNIDRVIALAEKKASILVYQIEAPLEIRMERVKSGFENGDRKRLLTEEHVKRNDDIYSKEKYPHARVFDSSLMSTDEIVVAIKQDITKL